jgi:2'-5' RNA ligase
MAHEQLLRLFIAVDLPEPVRATLAKLQTRLKPIYNSGTFGKPENFHITLHFLGDTAVSRLPILIDALQQIEMPFLDLRPEGLVHFPDARRARVAAVAIAGDVLMLSDLHARLSPVIKELGFRLEGRLFKPHVTIARFKFPPRGDAPQQAVNAATQLLARTPTGRIGQFTLFQSTLDPKGPRYAALGRFPKQTF